MSAVDSLTVIVHCYNHVDTLERCVGSLLEQDLRAMEILIVDDHSSDGSTALARSLESKNRERIRLWTSPQNLGNAREAWWASGFTVTGRYWARVDGDDAWLSQERARSQIQLLEENGDWIGVSCITQVYEGASSQNVQFIQSERDKWKFRDWWRQSPMLYCHMNSIMWRTQPSTLFMLNTNVDALWPRGEWAMTLGILAINPRAHLGRWNRIGALYDVSSDGVWSSSTEDQRIRKNQIADECMRLNVEQLRTRFKGSAHETRFPHPFWSKRKRLQ